MAGGWAGALKKLDEEVAKLGSIEIESYEDTHYPMVGNGIDCSDHLVRVIVYREVKG